MKYIIKIGVEKITQTTISFEEIASSIINNSSNAVIATDLDCKILLWNKAAENLFGYKQEEILGTTIPIIRNINGYEFTRIIEESKNNNSLMFRTQKLDKNNNTLDIVIQTNPIKINNEIIGIAFHIQNFEPIKSLTYLPINETPMDREAKRTFHVIRDLILCTLNSKKKTINQISQDSGINWRTVEKHLTFLIGKRLVSEVFSSEYVRIFETTENGLQHIEKIKQNYKQNI
jgi:PAS domain S-box-containing protein